MIILYLHASIYLLAVAVLNNDNILDESFLAGWQSITLTMMMMMMMMMTMTTTTTTRITIKGCLHYDTCTPYMYVVHVYGVHVS